MSRLEREINLGITPHDRLADGRNIWAAPALLYRRWAQEPGLMMRMPAAIAVTTLFPGVNGRIGALASTRRVPICRYSRDLP